MLYYSCTCLTPSIIEVARRVITLHQMSYALGHCTVELGTSVQGQLLS